MLSTGTSPGSGRLAHSAGSRPTGCTWRRWVHRALHLLEEAAGPGSPYPVCSSFSPRLTGPHRGLAGVRMQKRQEATAPLGQAQRGRSSHRRSGPQPTLSQLQVQPSSLKLLALKYAGNETDLTWGNPASCSRPGLGLPSPVFRACEA